MRFKLDENLPAEAGDRLRRHGFDAVSVYDQALGGFPDRDVARVCQDEGRALITLDTDFADIRAYPPASYSGLIVLRLQRQDKPHVLEVLERLVPMVASEPLVKRLWVVGERHVRIRE
jgi:predicted nuclease of predicted toxin-antitoxin system